MAVKRYAKVNSGYALCNKCNKEIGLVLDGTRIVPVDPAPSCYRLHGDEPENPRRGDGWLNGVRYSLKHECDDSNYAKYYEDAIEEDDWQRSTDFK